MSNHDCARMDYSAKPFPVFTPSKACAGCDANFRKRLAPLVPLLPELRAWMTGNAEMSQETEQALYEHFFMDMDYGTQTGDTSTFDQWICDRPEVVEELIADIEWSLEAA